MNIIPVYELDITQSKEEKNTFYENVQDLLYTTTHGT